MDASDPGFLTRRKLLIGGAALGAGAAAAFVGLRLAQDGGTGKRVPGFGPLVRDPACVLDLPTGFSYTRLSEVGETMSDGLLVPAAHDGMAAFPGPDGVTILVRNHELTVSAHNGPFGIEGELLDKIDSSLLFDPGSEGARLQGGTTTLVYDTQAKELRSHHLSLGGTIRNCAGGPTPWGSWISCEESTIRAGEDTAITKDHGWAFEVPTTASGLVAGEPLVAMGRFNREAIAIHAASGVVYQTEDRGDGLLYRFVPKTPGKLADGGRLGALQITGRPGLVTSNRGVGRSVSWNEVMRVDWIPLDNPESPKDDLRLRGATAGAAIFSRGEGICTAHDGIFFMCTNGGPARRGQVWRYRPSPHEGTQREVEAPATLELFAEPNDAALLSNGDNITVAPFGDLVICEDTSGVNRVVGVTPQGGLYELARNALNQSELAGGTFSADGATLFVNVQNPGLTLAITGPWERRRSA